MVLQALRNPRQAILGFLILAIILFFYSDPLTEFISRQSPFLILILSTFISPIYLFFIYVLYKDYGWRGLIAGFLISTASDLISLPHFLLKSGAVNNSANALISDFIFIRFVPSSFNVPINTSFGTFNLGTFISYVILSTLLIIIALMVAHRKKFKQIFERSINGGG